MPGQDSHSTSTSHEEDDSDHAVVLTTQDGQQHGTHKKRFQGRGFSWGNPLVIAIIFGICGLITLTLSHADSSGIKRLAPLQAATVTTTQPEFKWEPIATNATYQIQISSKVKSSNGTNTLTTLIDTTVPATSYTAGKVLAAGNYVWRIRGITPKTTWSSSWNFMITGTGTPVGGGGGTPPPPPPSGGGITPTAGAINVRNPAYGAKGDGTGDDTAAFKKAIAAAGSISAVKFLAGPGGQPQGVVYVPPGTYRLLELPFSSNIRMEVDAGAVLEQAGGVNVGATSVTLIRWDGPVGSPLKNVSLVGVGSSNTPLKARANPVAAGRSISGSFTFNVDAADTGSSNRMSGLIIMNTQGFLVENVFSIENDHIPDISPTNSNIKDNNDAYPTSQKAVLVMRARADSPCGGPYAQPLNGTISNWYNIHGPKGYGPNQIGAGQNIALEHIFTQGGTTLRLETDSSLPSSTGPKCPSGKTKFGSEIRGLAATDIEGLNCNRAVAFVPHLQDNYSVTVTNVLATDCSQGVIESKSPLFHLEGSFNNSSITNVRVIGSGSQKLAQNGTSGQIIGYWTIGESRQAFARDNGLAWWVTYTNPVSCQGSFQAASSTIHTASSTTKPTCAS